MRLKDSKGLRFLAHLLRHPGVEFGALELATTGDRAIIRTGAPRQPGTRERFEARLETRDLGDAGAILDRRAKEEYRTRLGDLRTELDEAEANNDRGRAERLRAEIEALSRELATAVGLGGRDRRAASSSERARVAVTKAIRSAISTIEREDEDLGARLRRSVRTGNTFCYRPEHAGTVGG
jgi:non-specific serine/threonine protein kinase